MSTPPREKVRDIAKRLQGIDLMLQEKIERVREILTGLNNEINALIDTLLSEGEIEQETIVKVDAVSLLKKKHVYVRSYKVYNTLRVNLIKLNANVNVHEVSFSVRDALQLIPPNLTSIKLDKGFCLATQYSDALDKVMTKIELPLSTAELQNPDTDDRIDEELNRLLDRRRRIKAPPKPAVVPRLEIDPAALHPLSDRVPVALA